MQASDRGNTHSSRDVVNFGARNSGINVVQDAFRLTTNCQGIKMADDNVDGAQGPEQDPHLHCRGAISSEEVSAVMDWRGFTTPLPKCRITAVA